MSEPNHAGSIIINLASLPDFLRRPILKKRMAEFFSMDVQERNDTIRNALEAGPTVPFPNFSKLFGTWLEVLAEFSEQQRTLLFSGYMDMICARPQLLIRFNLDGILEVYETLGEGQKVVISETIGRVIEGLDAESKRRILLVIPQKARILFDL